MSENQQWTSERRSITGHGYKDPSAKTVQNFLDFISASSIFSSDWFDEIANWIVEQDGDLAGLEERAGLLVSEHLPDFLDGQSILMTVACAAALSRSPSLQTWDKVAIFRYNSWQIENWLGKAMIAYTQVAPDSCEAYVDLAINAFHGLEDFSLKSKSDRANEERVAAWSSWRNGRGGLEEIWWGLRGWHGFMNYESELPLFEVFYKINPDKFIHTLSKSINPYLVSSLVSVAGIGAFSPRFSEWKKMICAAPSAFGADGKWNGLVLMPLLLVEARNQLLQTWTELRSPELSPEEIDEVKREISGIAGHIVCALRSRDDLAAIYVRWTPWLVRQILGHTIQEISDVSSSAFSDNALIGAIGENLEGHLLHESVPDDAAPWENWCYRCALSSFYYDGYSQAPAWEDFGNEWRLSPDDWAGDKGKILREHADIITTLNKEMPGFASYLLAYPISKCPSPEDAWIGMWGDAVVLRELVEFGDFDMSEDEYSSRSEASGLLLFLFSIGLAILDTISAQCFDENSSEARSAADLFMALEFSASEMREIDRTLSNDKWVAIGQHLAVRRVIWEKRSDYDESSEKFNVFKSDDLPTVASILAKEKGDVIEVVAVLQALLLNGVPEPRLKEEVNLSSIDLYYVLKSVRTLNKIHPRKYPIDETKLKSLERFI